MTWQWTRNTTQHHVPLCSQIHIPTEKPFYIPYLTHTVFKTPLQIFFTWRYDAVQLASHLIRSPQRHREIAQEITCMSTSYRLPSLLTLRTKWVLKRNRHDQCLWWKTCVCNFSRGKGKRCVWEVSCKSENTRHHHHKVRVKRACCPTLNCTFWFWFFFKKRKDKSSEQERKKLFFFFFPPYQLCCSEKFPHSFAYSSPG